MTAEQAQAARRGATGLAIDFDDGSETPAASDLRAPLAPPGSPPKGASNRAAVRDQAVRRTTEPASALPSLVWRSRLRRRHLQWRSSRYLLRSTSFFHSGDQIWWWICLCWRVPLPPSAGVFWVFLGTFLVFFSSQGKGKIRGRICYKQHLSHRTLPLKAFSRWHSL